MDIPGLGEQVYGWPLKNDSIRDLSSSGTASKLGHNLFGSGSAALEAIANSLGEPSFRGRQLARWLFRRGACDFSLMSDLPNEFRSHLGEAGFVAGSLSLLRHQQASDGTEKYLFGSRRGSTLEAVLMPEVRRATACISTQVGCAVGCVFCATGLSGFQKNVTAAEMVEQVVRMQNHGAVRISNVVFMGMGEPFLNTDETLKAVNLLNREVGIGMRHITISTSGIVPGIDRLAAERLQLTLAISLHAANDELRNELVPINRRYPLDALRNAMQRYAQATNRRISVEYVMLRGVNDQNAHAIELTAFLAPIPGTHINLIPYNATEAEFQPSSPKRIREFREILSRHGINATIRVQRGAQIDGACGQLRRRLIRETGSLDQA